MFPCDSPASAGFRFTGLSRAFNAAASTLIAAQVSPTMCYGSVIGIDYQLDGEPISLIGVNWLKSFYTAFDVDNETISIATAKQ